MIRASTWAPVERLRSSSLVTTLGALAVAVAAFSPLHPWLVLIVPGILLLVVVAIARPELALLVLVAMGPLELALPQSTNSQLSVTKLAGLLCFSTFALNTIFTRRRLTFDRHHGLVFALLGIALVSTLGATDAAAAKTTTLRYAAFVALFFVLSQLSGSLRLSEHVAWVLSLASAALAALGLANFFSGALQVGFANVNANDIGFALATTLPLTLWLVARTPAILRLFLLGVVGLDVLAILLTLSRGTLVGLAAAGLWMLLIDRRHIRALLATALVAGIAVGLTLHYQHNQIELGLKAKQKVAAENVQSRLAAWHAAADFATKNPLLGIGPGNFAGRYHDVAEQPAGQDVVRVVHNAYLDVAAELGPPAMVIFVLYVMTTLMRLGRLQKQRRGPPGFSSALLYAMIIASCSALTLSEQFFAPFWLIGGLTAGLWRTSMRDDAAAPGA
jgi:O-antigen ligase